MMQKSRKRRLPKREVALYFAPLEFKWQNRNKMDILIINVKNTAKNEKSELIIGKIIKNCPDVVNVEKYVHILVKTNNLL